MPTEPGVAARSRTLDEIAGSFNPVAVRAIGPMDSYSALARTKAV